MSNIVAITLVENSSVFDGHGYDAANRVLALRFKNTGQVRYHQDVPPELYDELREADSLGRFYTSAIKGKFDSAPADEQQG